MSDDMTARDRSMAEQLAAQFGPLCVENVDNQFCSDWLKGEIHRVFEELQREHERSEQLQVQLAGCLTAAEGGTRPPVVAEKGQYGWSLAYQRTLDLYRKYERYQEALRVASKILDNIKFDLNASVYTLEDDEFETVFAVRDLCDLTLAKEPT